MAQEVVTSLVIDADTSGADQFSQSMDRANASAQQGVGSVAGLTLAVAGVGVAFVGSLAALRGFVDYVGNTNKELIDLATNAANAGMSTKDFQETLFAAKSAGLSDKDFVAGLDKIGADLQAASRGASAFGDLFKENGLSIKDANGELKTTEQAMGDISNLIRNAPTPQLATAVASIVGLSKDWIPFLMEGVDGIEAQKKAAADLGVTIDDSTIQKAKDFNDQWHTAIATWDLQFKASLAGILPLLIQAANLASKIIDGVGSIGSSLSLWTTPDDQKSKQQLNDQADYATKLIDLQSRLGDSPGGLAGVKINNLQNLLGIPAGSTIDQATAYLDKLTALYDKAPTKISVTMPGDGSTVLPPKPEANDLLDRAIIMTQRHTAMIEADTAAVGLGAGALAEYKAQAALVTAAQQNGTPVTQALADKFQDLAQDAGDAAAALAKARVANEVGFGAATAFLSNQDVAIASRLKDVYPDVTTALNSAEGAQMRFNFAARQLSSELENDLVGGLADITSGTKSVGQGFQDMGSAVVRTIEQMIIKIAIIQPMMAALQSSANGLGINFGGSTSIGSLGQAANATGLGAGTGGLSFPMFASGTDSAPGGWSIIGENGPELMKVPTGAQILPNGVPPSGSSGGTQVNVNVQNYGNDNVSVNQRQNSNGGVDLEVMVGQAAASQMAKKGSPLRQITDNRALLASR